MDAIESALNDMLEKNLESMRENLNVALSQKAAEALEERKKSIAADYFESR